jgi:hypothetical protein
LTLYEIEFCKKNIISDVSEIYDSASTTNENKFKIIDRNTDISYGSIGATTGTRTITFTFSSNKTIDRLIFQGVNWKNFTIKYNGSTDFTSAISGTNNTATELYYRVTKVTNVASVTISVTATMTTGDVVRCSEATLTESLYCPTSTPASNGEGLKYIPVVSQRINELSDGTFDKTFIKSSFGYSIGMSLLSATDQLNYKSVFDYNRRNSIFFIPEPNDTPGSWNGISSHVHWNNALDIYNASLGLTLNGYDAIISLIPASGIG